MPKIFTVARREYLETTRTKTFLLGLLLPPAIMAIMILVTGRMEKNITTGPRPTMTVAVSDQSGKLATELQNAFKTFNEFHPQRRIEMSLGNWGETQLQEKVRQSAVNGALIIPVNITTGGASRFYAKMRDMSDQELIAIVGDLLNKAVFNLRVRAHGLSPELMTELQRRVAIEPRDVSSKGTTQHGPSVERMMVPFAFMFLMFIGIFSMNQHILTAVIEEKNSRVMEVLLSTLTPFQLLAGKILGMATVGFTMVAFWSALAYSAASARGLIDIGNTLTFVCFIVYYFLGFLFFSSIFAAIGAACNSIKEAQNLIAPITMLLVIPMMGWLYFSQHPEAPLTIALSMFPLTSPMVMMLRVTARPETPILQIVLSIAILAASVPAAIWASAKIFRTGVLMYGKPPSLPELFRWLRYK